MTVTVSQLTTAANELGDVAVTAVKAVIDAEELKDTSGAALDGAAKKAYVVAVVADEIGDQAEVVGGKISTFIDLFVAFLNQYGWASSLIAKITSVATILAYVPSGMAVIANAVADVADWIAEQLSGDEIDQETGEVTEAEEEVSEEEADTAKETEEADEE